MASLLNMSGGSLLNKALPYDYEVEWLKSTGTQYIDTGIYPDTNNNCEISCYVEAPLPTGIKDFYSPFGCLSGWAKKYFGFIWNNANQLYFMLGNQGNVLKSNMNLSNYVDSWHIFKIRNKKGYFNDTLIGSYTQGYVKAERTLSLFRANPNYGNQATRRVSYFKMTDVYENPIIDLIPVVKDNIGYMYDKVSGQLFGNSGTGDFILGPDKTN